MGSPPAYDTTRIAESLATTKVQVNNRMRLLASQLNDLSDSHLQSVASNGQGSVVDMLREAGKLEESTLAANPDVVTNAVVRSRMLGVYGVPLLELIERNTSDAGREIMATVRRGIVSKMDLKQVILTTQPIIIKRDNQSTSRTTESLFSRSIKAVRTEFAALYREGQFGAAKASGLDLVWESVLSDKHMMPDICTENNGLIMQSSHPMLKRFPYHVNCLCYLQPGLPE
jgi:hypothetical protein